MSDCSDPMDCSLRGSSIHGIFQAKVLEWVAIVFSVSYVTRELQVKTTMRYYTHMHTRCLCSFAKAASTNFIVWVA